MRAVGLDGELPGSGARYRVTLRLPLVADTDQRRLDVHQVRLVLDERT